MRHPSRRSGPQQGTTSAGLLVRFAALSALVFGILIHGSILESDGHGLGALRASAQASSVTATATMPQLPTPTATAVIVSPTATVVQQTPTGIPAATETAFVFHTWTPEPSPSATGTPTPTVTGTSTSTAGPTDTATATPTFTATPTPPPVVEEIIDSTGGVVASADGSVTLTFPPGATNEPLRISITDRAKTDVPEIAGAHLLSVWQFDAHAVDRGDAEVHQFGSDIAIDMSYSASDMFGLNEERLRYWTLDEQTNGWEEVATLVVDDHRWVAAVDHFSIGASSADGVILTPPTLDTAEVSASTGAATFNLPIQVAPGLGGSEPALGLSYSSGRVDAMGLIVAPGWVGTGWDLSVPSITRAVPTTIGAPGRYFLNLGGTGGELIPLATDSTKYVTRNQSFLDITHPTGCDDAVAASSVDLAAFADSAGCSWTVRDNTGRVWTFGTSANTRRYYYASNYNVRMYQWDLLNTIDVHGNKTEYSYTQIKGNRDTDISWREWVFASYPSSITYPGGKVEFELDPNLYAPVFDGPPWDFYTFSYRGDTGGSCFLGGDASNGLAKVYDLRALKRIKTFTQTSGTLLTPGYGLTSEYEFTGSIHNGPGCFSFGYRLDDVKLLGDSPGSPLMTYAFGYGTPGSLDPPTRESIHPKLANGLPYEPTQENTPYSVSNWRLKTIANSFGGEVQFAYEHADNGFFGAGTWHYSTYVVTTKTAKSRFDSASNPDVVTTYNYSGFALDQTTSGEALRPWFVIDGAGIASRGFKSSQRTTGNSRTRQEFILGYDGPPSGFPAEPTGAKELAGRVVKTEQTDAANTLFQRTTNSYLSTAVADTSNKAFFNRLASETVRFRYGTESQTTYTHSLVHGGMLTRNENQSGSASAYGCRATTNAYHYRNDATVLLLLPSTVQTKECGVPALVAETAYFYDGRQSVSATPVVGNITATRKLVSLTDADPNRRYVYTLSSYTSDGKGNVETRSVPVYGSDSSPLGDAPTVNGSAWTGGRTLTQYLAGSGFRFPEQVTNYVYVGTQLVSTQTTLYQYNLAHGSPTLITYPSGLQEGATYDRFGRMLKHWSAPDTESSPSETFDYSGWSGTAGTGVNFTTTTKRLNAAATITTTICSDGFGRETQRQIPYFKAGPNPSDLRVQRAQTIYDTRGLVANSRLFAAGTSTSCAPTAIGAYQSGSALVPNNKSQYDALGRIITTTVDDGNSPAGNVATVSAEYSDNGLFTTITIDEKGHQRASVSDFLGRLRTTTTYVGQGTPMVPAAHSVTKYEYDIVGNATKVIENDNVAVARHETVMTYDSLGRVLTSTDPDRSGNPVTSDGTSPTPWRYKFDAAGNVIEVVDARGVKTTLMYDSHNRLLSKTYDVGASGVGAQSPVTFAYDDYGTGTPCVNDNTDVGRLTSMSDATGLTRWCYDVRGREVKKEHKINAVYGNATTQAPYVINRAYDSANRPTTLTYPDGEIVSYVYDNAGGGQLVSMTSSIPGSPAYVSGAKYDHPTGQLTQITLGNSVVTNYTYDALYRLRTIETDQPIPLLPLQDLTYSYQPNGNISSITDGTTDGEDLFYKYDDLDRLTEVRKDSESGDVVASYAFANSGADLGKLTSKTEDQLVSMSYGDPDHVHAVSGTSQGDKFTYDNNGNVKSRIAGETYNYDVENRLRSWSTYPTQTDNWYDGAGALKRTWTTAPGAAGAVDQKTTYIDGIYEEHCEFGGTPVASKYYVAFGRVIAHRGADTGVTWFLADHLGSTVGTVDENYDAQRVEYYPYGGVRGGSITQEKLFTGHQLQRYSRLADYNFGARFYSSGWGRFTSADPFTVDGADRYGYVRGNPMRFTDPFGLWCMDPATVGPCQDELTCVGLECAGCTLLICDWKIGSCVLDPGAPGCCDLACQLVAIAAYCNGNPDPHDSLCFYGYNGPASSGTPGPSGGGPVARPLPDLCPSGCYSTPSGEGCWLWCIFEDSYGHASAAFTGCASGSFDDCLTAIYLLDLLPIVESCVLPAIVTGGTLLLVCGYVEGAIEGAATIGSVYQLIVSDCSAGTKLAIAATIWGSAGAGMASHGSEPLEITLYVTQTQLYSTC